MAKSKVRIVPLKLAGTASIKTKRVRQSDGKTVALRWIDTESPKFDVELSAIFAKARRDNLSLSPEIAKLTGLKNIKAHYIGETRIAKRGEKKVRQKKTAERHSARKP